MSAPRSSTVRCFKEVTGCVADDVAVHFLQRNQNKLTPSINDYFNNPQIADQILFNNSKKSTRAVPIIPAVSQIFNNYREGLYSKINILLISIQQYFSFLLLFTNKSKSIKKILSLYFLFYFLLF